MNNSIIRVLLFCVVCVTYSCSTSKFYGDEKLGAGYFLSKDGRYKSIDYSPDENYKGNGGYAVIKENVELLNHDKHYIIVQTSRYEKPANKIKGFWIIDKNIQLNLDDYKHQNEFNQLLKAGLTGPLDSVQFYQELKDRNINLRFKDK